MGRVNFKSGLVIIMYSLILSLVLGAGLYKIKSSFSNVENKTNIDKAKAIIVNSNTPNLLYKVMYECNNVTIREGNRSSINNEILNSKMVVSVNEI